MDLKDKDARKALMDSLGMEGIPRRTFLKGMLVTGAVTSFGALGMIDLSWASGPSLPRA